MSSVVAYGWVWNGSNWVPLLGSTAISGALAVVEQQAPAAEDNGNGVYAEVLKPLAVATYAPARDTTLGTVNAKSIKASAGNVYEVFWDNNNAAAQFLLFVDKASAPVNTDTPILAIRMPATSSGQFQLAMPLAFATGIAACISSTRNTVTLGTAADLSWTVLYK